MTDDINRIIGEAMAEVERDRRNSYWECLCGDTFDRGWKARRHALDEHNDLGYVTKQTVGE